MFLIQEHGLNARNFKHLSATSIRSDFNDCQAKIAAGRRRAMEEEITAVFSPLVAEVRSV
jgi:hypothetical protein